MVSDHGSVKSVDRIIKRSDGVVYRRRSKIMKQTQDKDGYMVVSLSKDGVTKKCKVHVLVAAAFVDGWFDGAEVDHIDNNRKNNAATNLQWVTHLENVSKSIASGNHMSCRDLTGSQNPNYGNRKLSRMYAEDRELAVIKQGRPGSQNGRSIPVKVIYEDGAEQAFAYTRECAEYLITQGYFTPSDINYISSKISKAAREGHTLHGLQFVIQ